MYVYITHVYNTVCDVSGPSIYSRHAIVSSHFNMCIHYIAYCDSIAFIDSTACEWTKVRNIQL